MFRLTLAALLVFAFFTNGYSQEKWKDLYAKYNYGNSFSGLEAKEDSQIVVLEKARIAAIKEFGKEHANYVNTINDLANVHLYIGHWSVAEPLFKEAIKIGAKVYGKESTDYVTLLKNLAHSYDNIFNYPQAEPFYRQAHEIEGRWDYYKKNPVEYGALSSKLASWYVKTGNYAEAELLFLQALAMEEKALGKQDQKYVAELHNLAFVYRIEGNYSKAEPLYRQFAELAKEVKTKDSNVITEADYAHAITNLARVYYDLGRYAEAEPLYNEALAIFIKFHGGIEPKTAYLLNNMGLLYDKMGRYEEAERFYLQLEDFWTEESQRGNVLNNLGLLYTHMENYAKAELYLEEAWKYRIIFSGRGHREYITTLNNLALLYRRMGNYAKAEPLYLECIDMKQREIVNAFPYFSEHEKENYWKLNKGYFTNFELFSLDRYKENPNILNSLYDLRLSTKGLLFSASNKIRDNILNSGDEALISAYHELKMKRDQISKVYVMSPNDKKEKGIDEKKLEDEANALEKQLSMKGLSLTSSSRHYTWHDVKAKLKKGEVAIEIARVRSNRKYNGQYVNRYAALIVSPNTVSHPDIVVLENGEELENRTIKYYQNCMMNKVVDDVSYNQFWRPIAEKIAAAKKIYFSADGVYNQISLNTLRNPATGKYLLDETDIQLVTSTRDLLTTHFTSVKSVRDASLFGYPDYNNSHSTSSGGARAVAFASAAEVKSDTAQRFFNGDDITELPGTKTEVETIRQLLAQKKVNSHEYLFDQATEAEIKKLSNPQLLHIATHGFFMSELPPALAEARGIDAQKTAENPLLLSGLLFAGAKQAFTPDRSGQQGEDGVLTAYEAMNLNLDKTELVVLSACETGLGVAVNGEGVYGLQRAFQVAGAKSVLMSLWSVSDEATQQLMTLFYEYWLGGKTPREAFRMAQLSLREKFPEPFYWGAFVLVGDSR